VNILEELPALLDDFTGLVAQLRRMTMGINLAESPSQHRLLLLSYSAFYSNFRSCLTLLRARQLSSVPLLLRPVLEACADIVNIINVDGYANRLHRTLDGQQLKYLQGLSNLKKKPNFVKKTSKNMKNSVATIMRRNFQKKKNSFLLEWKILILQSLA
jgi:hypothetical protein